MRLTFVEFAEESMAEDSFHRAKRLIDCHISVSARTRIGIGNRDSPKRLASAHPRLLPRFPLRQIQPKRRERIAVRPPVHNNAFNITRGIESRSAKHPRQLLPYVSLEFAVRRLQQFRAPRAILIAHRQSGLARRA